MWPRCLCLIGLLAIGMAFRMSTFAVLEQPVQPGPALNSLQEHELSDDDQEEDVHEGMTPDPEAAKKFRMLSLKHARALVAAQINDNDIYMLSDSQKTLHAFWTHQTTGLESMRMSYKGSGRQGFDARTWDFDAESQNTVEEQMQWSVRYRDTKVDRVGFGSHFYEKFAILPKGKTQNKDSLYTVKMVRDGFTGSREWAIIKGYCKQWLGGLATKCYGGGQLEPLHRVHCSPIDLNFRKQVYYKPGTPFRCMVTSMPLSKMPEDYEPPIWLEMKNGHLEFENEGQASAFDVALISVVAAAIKPAYDLGVWR